MRLIGPPIADPCFGGRKDKKPPFHLSPTLIAIARSDSGIPTEPLFLYWRQTNPKAYDRLEWDFLYAVIEKCGFYSGFIKQTEALLESLRAR